MHAPTADVDESMVERAQGEEVVAVVRAVTHAVHDVMDVEVAAIRAPGKSATVLVALGD